MFHQSFKSAAILVEDPVSVQTLIAGVDEKYTNTSTLIRKLRERDSSFIGCFMPDTLMRPNKSCSIMNFKQQGTTQIL